MLKIKTESLAKRCEICHQTDLFDPRRNFCQRCQTVSEVKPIIESVTVNNVNVNSPNFQITENVVIGIVNISVAIGAICGSVLAIFYWYHLLVIIAMAIIGGCIFLLFGLSLAAFLSLDSKYHTFSEIKRWVKNWLKAHSKLE